MSHRLGKASGRERTCTDCGAVETVRVDNSARRCRACTGVFVGKCRKKPKQLTLRLSREPARRNHRICKHCAVGFSVYRSTLSGKTNASGNFCSRPCYNAWMSTIPTNSFRGYGWFEARAEAIERAPFCAMCARLKRLEVHHVVPYRLTQDNAQRNLVPLCKKHHTTVDHLTRGLIAAGVPIDIIHLVVRSSLLEQQMVGATILRSIARG